MDDLIKFSKVLSEKNKLLNDLTDMLSAFSETWAQAERAYSIEKTVALKTKGHDGKYPTVDKAKGETNVANAKYDRDIAKRDYEILNTKIKNTWKQLESARTLISVEKSKMDLR